MMEKEAQQPSERARVKKNDRKVLPRFSLPTIILAGASDAKTF